MAEKIISLFNHKSGVGKTTLTYNVGAELAIHKGKKVLLIDADGQMNLTASMFGLSDTVEYSDERDRKWKKYLQKYMSFYDFVGKPKERKKMFCYQDKFNREFQGTLLENYNPVDDKCVFHLMTADEEYFALERTLYAYLRTDDLSREARDKVSEMVNKVKKLSECYDFILVDCSPSASSVLNGFFVLISHYFLCPLKCDFFSYQAMGKIGAIIENWEKLFRYCRSTTDSDCIDMKEKFLGIVVNETKKHNKQECDKVISEQSKRWAVRVNESINDFVMGSGRGNTVEENEFVRLYPSSHLYMITDETCNYTGKLKDIVDTAGIPFVLLNAEICKKYAGENLLRDSQENYKHNYEQYTAAISYIADGFIKLK